MPDKSISENNILDWYKHGEHDLRSAQILFREKGYTDTIAFLIEQAAEKYLKGYLISKGWKLKKTHDLELLVTEAVDYNVSLKQFLDYARTVSAFYIEHRYPPSPPIDYPREETASLMKQTENLIDLIKKEQ
jgi:HEPN domain-containing protein